MKKLITILALTTMCVGAYAQGKVAFANDSLHRYYMSPDLNKLSPADAALAGARTPVNGALAGGKTLVVDLFAGSSAGSLAYVTTTTMSALGPGAQNTANIAIAGLAGGTTGWFQYQIRDNAFQTATLAQAGGSYFGFSQVFSAVLSGTTAYNNLTLKTTPSFSTWADGDYVIPGGSFGRGAIEVGLVPIPEPSSMALAGLGAASLLIFRRRK